MCLFLTNGTRTNVRYERRFKRVIPVFIQGIYPWKTMKGYSFLSEDGNFLPISFQGIIPLKKHGNFVREYELPQRITEILEQFHVVVLQPALHTHSIA
jgi:hypothetical protein